MSWKVNCNIGDLILEQREKGKKYREIAESLGLSISTIANIINYGSNHDANEIYAKRINGYKNYREYRRNWEINRKWHGHESLENIGNDIY